MPGSTGSVSMEFEKGSLESLARELDAAGEDMQREFRDTIRDAAGTVALAARFTAPRRKPGRTRRRPIGKEPMVSKFAPGSGKRIPSDLVGRPVPRLADSFETTAHLTPAGFVAEVGNRLPQAAVHEWGGQIAPRLAHLTQPGKRGAVFGARRLAGRLEAKAKRLTDSGDAAAARQAAKLMADARSVRGQIITIKPSHMVGDAWDAVAPTVEADMQLAVDRAVARFNSAT